MKREFIPLKIPDYWTDGPSIQHNDHTKEYTSRFLKGQLPPLYQINKQIESSRFRSWVGYTTSTEERPEYFKRQALIPEEIEFRIPLCF